MLKNCKIKLSLWHKNISFEVKKSENNVLQNARNAVSARQPNFPPRYLFLWPCLVRRLVGSHPPVKRKKKTGYGPVHKLHQESMTQILPMTWPRVPGCRHDWYYKEGVGAEGRGQRICFYRHYYYFLVYPQTLFIIFRHPLLTGKMKKWQPPGLMRKVKYFQRCRVSRDMFRLEDWKKGVKIIDGSTKYLWRKGSCGRSHVRNRGVLRQSYLDYEG